MNDSQEILDADDYHSNVSVPNLNRNEFGTKSVENGDINLLAEQLLSSNETYSFANLTESLKGTLTSWQLSQLENVKGSELGVKCLLNSWLVTKNSLQEGMILRIFYNNLKVKN